MTKSFLKPAFTSLIVATLLGFAISLPAADEKPAPAKPEAPAPPRPPRLGKPYGGAISAVDKTAKTVTVKKKDSEKTFSITSASKIMKAGKPATLEDAMVGEDAGVFYKDSEDGKAEALSLRLGAKPEKPGAEKKKKMEDKPPAKKEAPAAVEEKKATP